MSKASWRFVTLVRGIDKHAAKIAAADAHVLQLLAEHADAEGLSYPSQDRLAKESGYTARNVRRSILRLTSAGLVDIVSGRRHHVPNHYRLREDTLSSLPKVETGHGVPSERRLSEDNDDTAERTLGPASEDMVSGERGHGVLRRIREGSKEGPEEGGAATPPAPPLDELREKEAFEIASAVAKRHDRPLPSKGEKSRDAMEQLIADANATRVRGPWVSPAEAFRLRMVAHYERYDDVLERCRWALSLALQVEQPVPEMPNEPRRPEEPRKPTPPMNDEAIAKFIADFKMGEGEEERFRARLLTPEQYAEELRKYECELRRYQNEELPAWRKRHDAWRAIVGARPTRNGPVVQMPGPGGPRWTVGRPKVQPDDAPEERAWTAGDGK